MIPAPVTRESYKMDKIPRRILLQFCVYNRKQGADLSSIIKFHKKRIFLFWSLGGGLQGNTDTFFF